jgi:hypothetical protein
MKIVAISLVLGFVLYPIAYSIPLTGNAADIGRLIGGGIAMSVVAYIVLRIGWIVWRKIVV